VHAHKLISAVHASILQDAVSATRVIVNVGSHIIHLEAADETKAAVAAINAMPLDNAKITKSHHVPVRSRRSNSSSCSVLCVYARGPDVLVYTCEVEKQIAGCCQRHPGDHRCRTSHHTPEGKNANTSRVLQWLQFCTVHSHRVHCKLPACLNKSLP
jgi:hypothetical protein